MNKKVFKYVIENGLTVLICPKKDSAKVALQMWYNVGSKHEQPSEKGMAHFLEHMIFKGTDKLLSETDINAMSQKLAAYANAFTSYDYTAYVFDVPVANWDLLLPIYADCMQNCSFLQDHMNSEVKAVIQELKMYRDDFRWALADGLIGNIFESHPYHFPIIGYKQDLWNLKRETFLKFYHKYYVPNNATFVVVGDVDPEEALKKINNAFGNIPRGQEIVHPEFFFNDELQSKTFTLYREVDQAHCMMAFALPGVHEKKDFLFDIIATLLANGKGSILYKKLVDELSLAVSVSAMTYDLFDRGIFFIEFKPHKEEDIEKIKNIIYQEIQKLGREKISDEQLRRAIKITEIDYQHLLEDAHKQASAIGKSFIAIGEEEYPFNYCNYNPDTILNDIQILLQKYMRSSLSYFGQVLCVAQIDKDILKALQEESDRLDTKILSGKERDTVVEPGRYVDTVIAKKFENKKFPIAETYQLANGLRVLLYQTSSVDLIECVLRYKADQQWDPKQQAGIGYLVSKMMLEGSKSYPGLSFIQEAESYGITFDTAPGFIECSMLSADINKGLDLMSQMIQEALFDSQDFERIKEKTKAQLIQFWDTPKRAINQVAMEQVYKDHPYAHMALGSQETLVNISIQDAYDFYKKIITPEEAVLVIVGNFDKNSLRLKIENCFSAWTGQKINDLDYPELTPVAKGYVDVFKNRDQIVLAFAGLSVGRLDTEYDALQVFNQLLSGSMNSYLFALREQTGLFYTIGGSLVMNAGKQPGMVFIKTIVSRDRLQEAEEVILQCLDSSIDMVQQKDFDEAKEMVINSFPSMFETFEDSAQTFLFLEKYKLPEDYWTKKIEEIRAMKLEDMKNIVKKYLHSNKLVCVRIGRI
ncbi:insulinase family protein [Candidatus Dependentiae bacterium]|nr:insulinase family protein [Candidatus Dependentiae bacterium]